MRSDHNPTSDAVRMTVHLSPSQIGAELAHEGAAEQANLLAGFLDELRRLCRSNYNINHQLRALFKNLDYADRELLGGALGVLDSDKD